MCEKLWKNRASTLYNVKQYEKFIINQNTVLKNIKIRVKYLKKIAIEPLKNAKDSGEMLKNEKKLCKMS